MSDVVPPRKRHIVFYLLFGLEWLFACWLLLEFVEAGRAFIAERAYREYSDEQNRKVYRMVPAEELNARENTFVPDEAYPVVMQSGGDIPSSGSGIATSEDLDMVFRGEMRASFNRQGELLESRGEPFIEQDLLRFLAGKKFHAPWQSFIEAIRSGQAQMQAQCSLNWGTPVHYSISMSGKDAAGGGDYLLMAKDINNQMPLEALHYGEIPGPESPWETMFFRYKKNWSHPGNTMLQTNNFGFRDHDVVVPKPPGVFRIVCIGGSTTEEGNSTDATYPKIVERKLAERFGQGKVEVINAGICGTNSYNIRRRFEDYLAMEPDLVLYYGGVNDTTHMHFQFWLDAVPKWKKWARRSFLLKRYFGFSLLPPAEELGQYMQNTTYRNLRAMRHAARQRGVEMAWCSFAYPTLHWSDIRARNYYDINMRDVWHGEGLINFRAYCHVTDVFNETGKRIAGEEGIPWFPVAEHFHAGPDHFFDICHMTPLGLELKANIFSGLIADYLVQKKFVHP